MDGRAHGRLPWGLWAGVVLLASAGAARADLVRGRVTADGQGLVLEGGDQALRLRADAATGRALTALAGRAVAVEGTVDDGRLEVVALVDPPRVVVQGVVREGALVEGDRAWPLAGPARALVPGDGARVAVDGVVAEGTLLVLAVEGWTQRTWTLITRRGMPVHVIHGRRAVWVVRARGDVLFVRRGSHEGWAPKDQITLGEPDSSGIIEGLPPG